MEVQLCLMKLQFDVVEHRYTALETELNFIYKDKLGRLEQLNKELLEEIKSKEDDFDELLNKNACIENEKALIDENIEYLNAQLQQKNLEINRLKDDLGLIKNESQELLEKVIKQAVDHKSQNEKYQTELDKINALYVEVKAAYEEERLINQRIQNERDLENDPSEKASLDSTPIINVEGI